MTRLSLCATLSDVSQPDQLTTRDVVEILGVSRATVKRMATDGRLPYLLKVPGDTGAYLFDRRTVERYARTIKAAS